jgi:protein CsiD
LTAADCLQQAVGGDFAERINQIVRDRRSGGFTLSVEGGLDGLDQQVALGTAVAHLLGLPNFDDMTGNYYACFTVQDTYDSDSYLRQAYRNFTLHTDGTYVKEATDWILMMKMEERHAVCGESRLLHLDDWEDLPRFSQDPLASHPFTYRSPPSKNYPVTLEKTTFYEKFGGPCMCFIDQFVYPDTLEQARYLRDLSASMEASPAVVSLPLPVDHLIVLNNHFWLHGRAAFAKDPKLHRVLMRQRGYFRD